MGIVERAEAQLMRDQERVRRFDGAAPSLVGVTEALRVTRASDIKPEPIRWLWSGWLARGKLHVLAGAPGTGKTTLAMALAATVTKGGHWPDKSRTTVANVVVWSGEDDPKDTLVPRLLAAGGDLSNVYFVGDVSGEDGERSFDPARDVQLLEQRLAQIGNVALLIVDPVVNAVAGDSHKNGEVRRALAPLVGLAQKHDAAVLGISHFSKGTAGREPLERVTGSLAFGALARVVLIAAKGKPEEEGDAAKRLFARAKSNIGPDDGGFEYLIEFGPLEQQPVIETSWVQWGMAIDGSARELLAAMEPVDDGEGGGAQQDAEDFLRDYLAGGSKPVREIQTAGKSAGHSWATIRRAKLALGARAIKSGMDSGWRWQLAAEGAHERAKVPSEIRRASSENIEHLRESSPAGDGWEVVE